MVAMNSVEVKHTSYEGEFKEGGSVQISHTSLGDGTLQIVFTRSSGDKRSMYMCDVELNKQEVEELAAALTEFAKIMTAVPEEKKDGN